MLLVNKKMKTVNYKNKEMGIEEKHNWKNKSKKYLLELESFLDMAESIKDEKLRKDIIIQMLKCDRELTILAEEIFEEKYDKGIRDCQEKFK